MMSNLQALTRRFVGADEAPIVWTTSAAGVITGR